MNNAMITDAEEMLSVLNLGRKEGFVAGVAVSLGILLVSGTARKAMNAVGCTIKRNKTTDR